MNIFGDFDSVGMLSAMDHNERSAGGKALGFAVATVADVGTSLWNSVTFGQADISTSSLLNSIGADGALSSYNNNRDSIELLSFIGGALIPGVGSLKLAKAVRDGNRAFSALSTTRKAEDLTKVTRLMEDGKRGHAEYRKLRNSMILRGQAEGLMDTVAAEVAIMGAMNAHPFMEDYFEDPVKNFGVSMLLGSAISAPLMAVGTRTAFRGAIGAVETAALTDIKGAAALLDVQFADTSSILNSIEAAAGRVEALSKLPTTNKFASDMAIDMAAQMRARAGQLADSKLPKQGLELEDRQYLKELMTTPEFLGIDTAKYYKPAEVGYLAKVKGLIDQKAKPVFRTFGDDGEEIVTRHYYSGDHRSFVPKDHVENLASAADTHTADSIAKLSKGFTLKQLRNTYKDMVLGSSSQLEANYLARIDYYGKLPTSDLAKVELMSGDLPAMNGLIHSVRNRKLRINSDLQKTTDPKVMLKLTEELAELENLAIRTHSKDQVKLVHIDEVGQLPIAGVTASPADMVSSTHFSDQANLFSGTGAKASPLVNARSFHEVAHPLAAKYLSARNAYYKLGPNSDWSGISAKELLAYDERFLAGKGGEWMNQFFDGTEAAALTDMSKLQLLKWIAGQPVDKNMLRNGIESARTTRKGTTSHVVFHEQWQEILASPVIARQKEALSAVTDANGYMYVYRGMKGDPTGSTAIESFTHNRRVAEGFGTVKTFRIHSDDVIGYLYHGEAEYLVGSTTRDTIQSVSDRAKSTPMGQVSPGAKQETLSLRELEERYVKTLTTDLKKSLDEGMPPEVAALRHNITADAALLLPSMDRHFAKLAKEGNLTEQHWDILSRWKSPSDMGAALGKERRILQATAKTQHHAGQGGQLLDKQRQAIETGLVLDTEMKAAINATDNLAMESISAKMAVNNKVYEDVHKEWVNLSLATSQSELAKTMLTAVVDNDLTKILRETMSEAVNAKGGNPLFQSADMVMRKMEEFGRVVAAIGESRGEHTNRIMKKVLEPVSSGLRKLETQPAARAEFALLDQFRAQNKGVLNFDVDEGSFYRTLGTDKETGEVIKEFVGPVVESSIVKNLFGDMEAAGAELYQARVTASRLANGNVPENIGFWMPSTKLLGREYAYVQNLETHEIKLLVADTRDELMQLKSAYKPSEHERIIERSHAEMENLSLLEDGRIAKVTLSDVDANKRGIGPAVADISSSRLEDIVQGYSSQFNVLATRILEESLHDVIKGLDMMSSINSRAITDTGKSGWRKAATQLTTKDSAADAKDYLLGRNPAHRSELMKTINNASDTVITYAARAADAAWKVVRPEKLGSPVDFDKYLNTLSSNGIPNPFAAFAEADQAALFAKARSAGYGDNPQRIVNAFNALASTTALKFFEIAQPLVNILSLPILMSSSISRMADLKTITGSTMLENSQMAIMTNGVRRAWSKAPENLRLMELAKEEGLLTSMVTEADAALRLSKLHAGGAIGGLEKALESSFMKLAGAPSEHADALVRKVTFGTAVEVAIRMYGPNVTDRQIMIFARDFMKQAIGNYTSSQRPAMFQGSFGAAMGLFQTYMVTYAQNMYSHMEVGDRKGLAKMMLLQGGIFGTGSLPGWAPISEVIGNNFSDEHFDLNTGLYRALPDSIANSLVYGLPSNLVGALHTRGDVSPRIPSGFHEFVSPSIVLQLTEAMVGVGKGMLQFDGTSGTAMLEALSLQSANRPIARIAELANGYAVTRAGRIVAGEEEVWSFQGVLARALSVRTLSEAKAREAVHLNTVYGQNDRENRQALIRGIKQDLRSNNLSNDRLDGYAHEYLRTGSPQGFKQAYTEAVMQHENPGVMDLTKQLKDSPLSLLLDDMDL